MIIAEKLYRGIETGITGIELEHRKDMLARFLAHNPRPNNFETEYLDWLKNEDEGQAGGLVAIVRSDSQGANLEVPCSSCEVQASVEPDIELPTAYEMAKNLGNSVIDGLGDFVRNGIFLASKDEYNRRFAICKICEFLVDERCAKCGCYMKLKAKVNAMKCMANKW